MRTPKRTSEWTDSGLTQTSEERMEDQAVLRGWAVPNDIKVKAIERMRERLNSGLGPDGAPITAREEARYMDVIAKWEAQNIGDLQHREKLEQADRHHQDKLGDTRPISVRIVEGDDD